MSTNENSLFRLFVIGWMSLGGVNMAIYFLFDFLGCSHDTVGNIMGLGTLTLLSVLIYSYVSGKDKLLKTLSYAYILVGLPFLLMMFVVAVAGV